MTSQEKLNEKLAWEQLIKDRQKKFFEIIDSLNKQRRQGEADIFDCGKLGFVHIWWHHSWEHRWFTPNKEFFS